MKRLLELIFPTKPSPKLTADVQRTNSALEQVRKEHRESLQRADQKMAESVKIAQEALRDRHDR